MGLKEYHKKRDFKKTPEPKGKEKKGSSSNFLYVIQKHAASHLHYDLRLELDGVLKSWAVPKGPSLDPTIKRLAVHVEDHPIDYGDFEGVIPEGHYGAGEVIVWDTGSWITQDEDPKQAYKKGNMTFLLKGKKLKGVWKLIRIHSDPKNWLLVKVNDRHAKSESEYVITDENKSVLSSNTVESMKKTDSSIKLNNKKPTKAKTTSTIKNQISGIKKKPMFKKILPELATLVDQPSDDPIWLNEIKFDGYRLICFIEDKKIRLMTRRQLDWTHKFPTLVSELKKLKIRNAIMDGEVVILDENQHSNFQLLQNYLSAQTGVSLNLSSPGRAAENTGPIYYIFDLMYYDEYDFTHVPLIERKKKLKEILSWDHSIIRFSDHIIGEGVEVFKNACKIGLEGIVAKNINSFYLQKRTRDWLKIKCTKRQEFVVGGFTKPTGGRSFFGSLLLGTFNEGKLIYCGHVGTGFNADSLQAMANLLNKNKSTHMPFTTNPPNMKKTTWVNPIIIVEVEFSEWTQDGVLRHPSFKGIRKDKLPHEVTMEIVHSNVAKPHDYSLTHPNKILYPEQGYTKLELAEYYDSVKDWILPYIINRPLTLVRCPEGYQKCFFQKHLNEKMNALYTVDIQESKGIEKYLYIKNWKGLLALIQLGVLEIHLWNCHVDKIEKPDMLIFDLDPDPEVEWKKVIQAAHHIREKLAHLSLEAFVKTTGGKGLHIVVPLERKTTWVELKTFAQNIVMELVEEKPKDYVGTMVKAKRIGKIFIDYLRNNRGATSVAPFSTRAKLNAPVATPLTWEELTTRIKPDFYTITNLPARLLKLKSDPWAEFFKVRQSIKKL